MTLSTDKITPGPGNYNGDYSKFKHNDGGTVIGKSKRDDSLEKSRLSIPGPGAYSYLNTIGRDSPSKSFGGKAGELLEVKEQKRIPGPGAYDPHYERLKRNESGFKIGR